MKRFLVLAGLSFCLALVASPPEAKAQQLMTTVTKITSTTVTGDAVSFEDVTNKVAMTYKKGMFSAKTVGYSGGTVTFRDLHNGKTIWQGAVSGVTITGYATDSLKILYIRQFLHN
ncbi:hypothetical protein GCM10028805_22560 [Spirosoma harenae]